MLLIDVYRWKTFSYVYSGMALPTILLLLLGAAIGGAVPNVPEWSTAYDKYSVGGVLAEMLTPAGGFGKFVVVVLAFSVVANIAVSQYSVSLNIQMVHPVFTKVPRSIFTLITTLVLIPVSIKAATSFFENLENFLGIISYWSAAFCAIIILEFIWFRNMSYATYDHSIWNVATQLPYGIAAISALICSFGLVVPCMAEIWYTGPIAKHTGDIGFEVAFVLSGMLYLPFRTLEIRMRGGHL
jgi:purine-cytosine permease-like protein